MHGWVIFCAAVTLLIWLALLPTSLRRRRLRRRGRRTTAVCREHLNPDSSDGPIRIHCTFRPSPDQGEYHVVVRTRERIPQVGDEFDIVYDPENPRHAENLEVTGSSWYGYEDVLVPLMLFGVNLLILGFATVMTNAL